MFILLELRSATQISWSMSGSAAKVAVDAARKMMRKS